MGTQSYDIFRRDDEGEVWVEAARDLETAKSRIIELSANTPGQYVVFSQRSGRMVGSGTVVASPPRAPLPRHHRNLRLWNQTLFGSCTLGIASPRGEKWIQANVLTLCEKKVKSYLLAGRRCGTQRRQVSVEELLSFWPGEYQIFDLETKAGRTDNFGHFSMLSKCRSATPLTKHARYARKSRPPLKSGMI